MARSYGSRRWRPVRRGANIAPKRWVPIQKAPEQASAGTIEESRIYSKDFLLRVFGSMALNSDLSTHPGDSSSDSDAAEPGSTAGSGIGRVGRTGPVSCGHPAPTNLRSFLDKVGVFEALDRGRFNVIKGAKMGSPGVTVKRAYFGDPGTAKEQRQLTAVKILQSKALAERWHRRADDYESFARGDYTDIECPLTEIGVYRVLAKEGGHPNIAKMWGVFADVAASETWLVLEFCGRGDLLDHIQARAARVERVCPEEELMHIAWQMLQAVGHLHLLDIGHRDISPENVLLSGPDMMVKLIDFGQSCLLRRDRESLPYRYFRKTAKDVQRSPEQYIPPKSACPELHLPVYPDGRVGEIVQLCELEGIGRIAEAYPFCEVRVQRGQAASREKEKFATGVGQQCEQSTVDAPLAGYEAAPADVFACGSVILTLHTGTTAWKTATFADKGFKFCYAYGVEALLRHWNKPFHTPCTGQLLTAMLCHSPARRASIAQCLSHPWFTKASASYEK